MVTTALKLRDTGFLGRKAMTNLDNMLKSRGKGPCSQSYGYYSSHVWIWVLAHKENWEAECWRTDALNCGAGEDSESSLDYKEIKPVNPKGNQP